MKKDDLVYVNHIMDSIKDIEEFVSGADNKKFQEDKMLKYAVVRCIEIIGEASKNFSTEFKKKHADIPWKEITGMRDKVIHDYGGVDYNLVWMVVQKDMPVLKKKLKSIL